MGVRHLAVVAGAGVLLVGCGSSSEPAARTVTVVQPAAVAEPPPVTTQPEPPRPSPAAKTKITVPNVVGKIHQDAQDTMQAAGLFNLAEEDATGQGRMLIIDRNWRVVSQSPRPGSRVSEDTTVTLRSKKLTDP